MPASTPDTRRQAAGASIQTSSEKGGKCAHPHGLVALVQLRVHHIVVHVLEVHARRQLPAHVPRGVKPAGGCKARWVPCGGEVADATSPPHGDRPIPRPKDHRREETRRDARCTHRACRSIHEGLAGAPTSEILSVSGLRLISCSHARGKWEIGRGLKESRAVNARQLGLRRGTRVRHVQGRFHREGKGPEPWPRACIPGQHTRSSCPHSW